jgi:hypothetical protein
MRFLVLLGSLAVATSCSSSNWHTFRAHGVSVRYPPGWTATSRALTPVTDPPQILAVASYPLPHDNRGADGCSPKEALDRLPADGAFIFGWEFGAAQSPRPPPKPSRFKLTGFARYECLGPSYALHFRESGRWFQIHVALGPRAGAATRATVLRILDSFEARRR